MTVPIRELANKLLPTSTTTIQPLQIAHLLFTIDMDIDTDFIRERSAFSSRINSRKLSIDSTALSMAYYKRMEIINNILNKDVQKLVDSLQLLYASNNEETGKGKTVSKATNNSLQNKTSYSYNEALALNNTPNPQDESISNNNTNMCPLQEIFNIQLPYKINQAIEQNS